MVKYKNKTSYEYHKRQLEKTYESTKKLTEFAKSILNEKVDYTLLDIACGSGSNIIELSKCFSNINYYGIDISNEAITLGNNFIESNNIKNISLIQGDLYDIKSSLNFKPDISIFIQTLFAIDEPFEALDKIMEVTNKYLIINSLFTHDSIYITTSAKDIINNKEYKFNIIPIIELENYLRKYNSKIIKIEDFIMPFDLPRKTNGLQSYTKRELDGTRLTFTSQIYLPWKFIAIEIN